MTFGVAEKRNRVALRLATHTTGQRQTGDGMDAGAKNVVARTLSNDELLARACSAVLGCCEGQAGKQLCQHSPLAPPAHG